MMNDGNATLNQLKEEVHKLCLRKGWGVEGVQNPQHVAMAMTVEMSELLEHFQWLNPDDVQALMTGRDPERVALIAEEFADGSVKTVGVNCTNCFVGFFMSKLIPDCYANLFVCHNKILLKVEINFDIASSYYSAKSV